jgi:hypothetical protein
MAETTAFSRWDTMFRISFSKSWGVIKTEFNWGM